MKLWFKKKVFFLIVLTAFQHLPHWPSMALVLENRHWFVYINIEDLYSEIWKRKWPSHIYMKMKMIRNNLCIPSVNINLKTRTHWTWCYFLHATSQCKNLSAQIIPTKEQIWSFTILSMSGKTYYIFLSQFLSPFQLVLTLYLKNKKQNWTSKSIIKICY